MFDSIKWTKSISAATLLASAVWLVHAQDDAPRKRPQVGGTPVEMPGLHNVIRVTDNLISGSGPEGKEAFDSLQRLGVKTVISVDGAKPNLDLAKKAGLRYVHVPIGYNGVPRERVLQLAKTMHELPGPFYIHCHHGKHRGPAATAVARLCADDRCTVTDALQLLKIAGTDPRYKGLFESIEKLKRPTESEWRSAVLVETVRVAEFTQSMVSIDHHFDNLKLARKSGWRTPKDHPDIEPAHEALQMLEQYRELRRQPAMLKKPTDFQTWLGEGEATAAEMERLLREMKKTRQLDKAMIEQAFARASATCTSCHAKYRD